jgi:uncharacterized SAM-binding protein YcdF (DUF218 family)
VKRWLVLASAAIFSWSFWPLLRPQLLPADGPPWLLVLDGYHRLDSALSLQAGAAHRGWPILLITCPRTGQPTLAQRARAMGPLVVLLEHPPHGGDTTGQAVALAQWLQNQRPQSRPARVLVLSDRAHFPRAAWTLQIAAGGLGTTVQPWPVDVTGASQEVLDRWAWPKLWPSVRDVLRLQLWRLNRSTGAVLNAPKREAKARACFVAHTESASNLGG